MTFVNGALRRGTAAFVGGPRQSLTFGLSKSVPFLEFMRTEKLTL